MKPTEEHVLKVAEDKVPGGIELGLRRFGGPRPGAPAVLLLHGGNTSGDTFLLPEGGLTRFLGERGYDVWILEWRSSPRVIGPLFARHEPPLGGSVWAECQLFTLDAVIDEDLPRALAAVRGRIGGDVPLSIVAHCLSGAAVCMAIARGKLEGFGVDGVVLGTLGLFVEAPWNGWIKAEDFILERALTNDPQSRGVDPHALATWPRDMKVAYEHWPRAWLPAGTRKSADESGDDSGDDGGGDDGDDVLRRIAFMFGRPYSMERVHPSLRGSAEAGRVFGPMHLGFYLHAAQMVRRGFVGRFDAPSVIDRPRLVRSAPVPAPMAKTAIAPAPANGAPRAADRDAPAARPRGDLIPTHFLGKRMTLLAAGQNQLWHRDAMDLMYEWLRSIAPRTGRDRVTKRVFPGYNLQELFWGTQAAADVYPVIELAVRPAAAAHRAPAVEAAAATAGRR